MNFHRHLLSYFSGLKFYVANTYSDISELDNLSGVVIKITDDIWHISDLILGSSCKNVSLDKICTGVRLVNQTGDDLSSYIHLRLKDYNNYKNLTLANISIYFDENHIRYFDLLEHKKHDEINGNLVFQFS